MSEISSVIEKVCKKYPKIPEKVITAIIMAYTEESNTFLMENGYAQITPDLRVDIVPITKRRYVLRGVEYVSQRLYKIKATLGEPLYKRISEEYEKFREVP